MIGKAFAAAILLSTLCTQVSAHPLTNDGGRALSLGSSIVREALHFLGSGNPTGSRGPWCADFTSLVLKRTGHRPLANRMAGSALSYGPKTNTPKQGDLIVLRNASHVGVFMGFDRHGQVEMVSGNWSHRVKVALLPRQSVLAFIQT